jgi:hypothetical protein
MKSSSEIVEIIDLGEATALLTLGFSLIRLESSEDQRHKIFIFEALHPNSSTVNVSDSLENYNRRRLNLDAYSFYRSGKELKNRIHEHNELNLR